MHCDDNSGETIFSFSAQFSLLTVTPSRTTHAWYSSAGVDGFLMSLNVMVSLLISLRSSRYSLEYGRLGSVFSVLQVSLCIGFYLLKPLPLPVACLCLIMHPCIREHWLSGFFLGAEY